MATLERQGYKAYQPKEKDKFNFWQDVMLPIAPAALTAAGAVIGGPVGAQLGSTVGSSLTSTFTDQDREKKGFAKAMDVVNTISPMASQFIGGAPSLPKLAKYGGSMNKKSYKAGGNLITIPGRKHIDGGTSIGNNAEAEINEEYYQLGEDSDFIFSNADELKFGGKTPASMARKIKSKYSLRPYDKLSKDSKEMELNALMQKQESLKESLGMDNDMNMFFEGGTRLKNGFDIGKSNIDLSNITNNFSPQGVFNPLWIPPTELNSAPNKGAVANTDANVTDKGDLDNITPFNLDKAKQLGNIATGAQLATAIPGLTTRASDVNYDRVTAPEIDLSSQRRASELSRNRIIASNRAGARGADSVGMALNFLGTANAGAQGQYGNEIAQSFLSEEQFNKQSEFEASKINADISRAEQEARIAEKDAARSMQLQSLADMAGYIGMGAAGQNQLAMAEGQINMLQNMGDFIYGMDENGNPVIRKKDKVTVSKYGGVIKRNRRK